MKTAKQVDSLINRIVIVDVFEDKLSFEIEYLDKTKNLTDKQVTPIRKKLVKAIESLGLKLQGQI